MNKKKTFFTYGIVFFIIIVLLLTLYLTTDLFKTKEQLFWKYLLKEKNEIINVLSNEKTRLYNERIKKSSYIKEGNITIAGENKLIKPMNIEIAEKGNKLEDYKNITFNVKYDNKSVNQTIIVEEDNYFYINNEALGNDYIRIENDNLKELAKKIGITNTDFIPNKIKDVDYNELFKISDEETRYILKKYIPIYRKYVNNKHYTKEENVELENENGKIVSFKVQVTEKQFKEMLIDVLNELANDEKTLNIISNKIKILDETNKYCKVNNIKNEIEKYLDLLEEKNVEDEIFLSIIVYRKENDVIKTEFVFNNERTISIQTDKKNIINIRQYDIMNNEINLKTFDGIIKTALNTISEVTYTKEIINDNTNKAELNIKCNLGIETVNINYNYVEQIKNNVDSIIRKDEIKYINADNFTNEIYETLLKKVLKINN